MLCRNTRQIRLLSSSACQHFLMERSFVSLCNLRILAIHLARVRLDRQGLCVQGQGVECGSQGRPLVVQAEKIGLTHKVAPIAVRVPTMTSQLTDSGRRLLQLRTELQTQARIGNQSWDTSSSRPQGAGLTPSPMVHLDRREGVFCSIAQMNLLLRQDNSEPYEPFGGDLLQPCHSCTARFLLQPMQ